MVNKKALIISISSLILLGIVTLILKYISENFNWMLEYIMIGLTLIFFGFIMYFIVSFGEDPNDKRGK